MTALVVAAAVPAVGKDAPRVVTEAVPLDVGEWLGFDSYPPAAIRAGEQGRVVAIVTIDATGHPSACRIDISIGSPVLEKGTCDVVLSKGKFAPARDAKGRAVASEMTMPVRWVLPGEGDYPLPSDPNDFTNITTIASDDTIIGCESLVNGKLQSNDLARCGLNPAGLRANVKVVGSYRLRSDFLIRNGDTPPPMPAAPLASRLLSLREARQTVDVEGVPTNCTMTFSGEWAEEQMRHPVPTACDAGQRFQPVRDKNGVPKPAHVLVVDRTTLLPPPN
ncbi:energy transducer TonB [uncultured Sphingomonas sp.]|uniref:energy transducer TonB n=1 Tax=uncultured Sphingomonas sp. TaxID=158754 RepID=UPI0030FA432E